MRSSKTILVVDDDVAIRRAIELKLQTAGYTVITAADGEDALARVQNDQPDALITDITMPKIDGKQLCELTNGIKLQRPFLTIIVTARILPDEREWVAAMTDTVFMEKPFSPSRMLGIVDRYLGVSS